MNTTTATQTTSLVRADQGGAYWNRTDWSSHLADSDLRFTLCGMRVLRVLQAVATVTPNCDKCAAAK